MQPVIDLDTERYVRVYRLTQHVYPKTDWTLQDLERGLDRRSVKGWAWVKHDEDATSEHIHLVFWTAKEVDPTTVAGWFRVPAEQVQRRSGGKRAIKEELDYIRHKTPAQQALGKTLYPDEVIHAVPGWDWRAWDKEMDQRLALAGGSRQRNRNIEKQMSEGLSVRDALLRSSLPESRLRRARARYLAAQPAPERRIAFYIYGDDWLAADLLGRGIAEALAGGEQDVFHLISNFDRYDGERVIYCEGFTGLDFFSLFNQDMRREFMSIHPVQTRFETQHGPTQLLHENVVISGVEPFEEFQLSLASAFGVSSIDIQLERASLPARSYLPIIIPIRADEFAVQINSGVLGDGPFEQYRSLGTFRMNLRQVLSKAQALPQPQRKEIEMASAKRHVSPVLEARNQIVKAITVAPDEEEYALADIERMLAESGQPIS